jgi:hypothetical protein
MQPAREIPGRESAKCLDFRDLKHALPGGPQRGCHLSAGFVEAVFLRQVDTVERG